MNRDDLTSEQAGKLKEVVHSQLGYLFRLRERMAKKGFPVDDKLFLLVDKAYDAAHSLFIELHYMSCSGVGKPPKAGDVSQVTKSETPSG